MNLKQLAVTIVLALALAGAALGQTPVDASTLPGAQFVSYYSVFPHIADNAYASQKDAVDSANKQESGHAAYRCIQWASDALVARTAGKTLPAKPVPTSSILLVRQDVLEPQRGTWLAQTEGPKFAECADLPPVVPPSTGGGIVSPNRLPSNQEMLESLATQIAKAQSTLDSIVAALKKQGVM